MANVTFGYDSGGAQKTHATLAAAFAAAATDDNLQGYYSNTTKSRYWYENVSGGTTKVVGVQGMLATRQLVFVYRADDWWNASGDLSGSAAQVTIQNLILIGLTGDAGADYAITWNDTTGGGAGVRVTNVIIIGWSQAVRATAGDANVVQIDNTLIMGSLRGILNNIAIKCYYTTIVGCLTEGVDNNSQASTFTNVGAFWNEDDFTELTNATVTYCASSDDTADDVGGAGNVINKADPDDLDFWGDAAEDIQGGTRGWDYRIVSSSDLAAAGTAVGGITTDCDGNSRGTPPSIGWHEGTSTAFGLASPSTTPTFAGITSLSDNADGTLTAQWSAGTTLDHYEVHVHTSAPSGADMTARTYLASAVDFGINESRIFQTASGDTLSMGTTYHVGVRAVNGSSQDANTATLSASVTDPNEAGGPHVVIDSTAPVQLANGSQTTIYTCPSDKRAVVYIHLCNTDSSARTVEIGKLNSGDSWADDLLILKTYSLAAAGGVGHTWDSGCITLEAGGTIQGEASVAAKVTANASVLEYTIE